MPSSHAALTGVCIHHVLRVVQSAAHRRTAAALGAQPGDLVSVRLPPSIIISQLTTHLSAPHHHCTHLSPSLPYSMYLDPALTTDDRWHVTRMIYGSQTDSFDFHKVDCLLHSLCIIYLLPSPL